MSVSTLEEHARTHTKNERRFNLSKYRLILISRNASLGPLGNVAREGSGRTSEASKEEGQNNVFLQFREHWEHFPRRI